MSLVCSVFCSGWMRCNQCRNDSMWLNDSRSSMHCEATEKVFAESKMKQLGPQGLESAVVWDILVVHVSCVKACNMAWNITHTGGKHACEVNRGVSSTCYWCKYQQITTVYSCSIVYICTSGGSYLGAFESTWLKTSNPGPRSCWTFTRNSVGWLGSALSCTDLRVVLIFLCFVLVLPFVVSFSSSFEDFSIQDRTRPVGQEIRQIKIWQFKNCFSLRTALQHGGQWFLQPSQEPGP